MKENISPEEKLLKLIRGEKKQRPAVTSDGAGGSQGGGQRCGIRGPGYRLWAGLGRVFNAVSAFRLAVVILCLSLGYLLITFFLSHPESAGNFSPGTAGRGKASATTLQPEAGSEDKSYDFYSRAFKERQIFIAPRQQEPEASRLSDAASAAAVEGLNLVGIISGDNPQAAIEDKKSGKVYYVVKGQAINGFQLESILEGRIVLIYKGQRFELYL